MLTDTHVHVWDTSRFRYPWLSSASSLRAAYRSDDIDRAGLLTTRMIAVEADVLPAERLMEARWIADSRAAWPDLAGIVGGVDLRRDLSAQLDALSHIDLVVGARQQLQAEAVESWNLPVLSEGLTELGRRGLTFDACVHHFQLATLLRLAEASPDTNIVLDHLGKPPVVAGLSSSIGGQWKEHVHRLAQLPHVYLKLSGLSAEAPDQAVFDAHADSFIAAAAEAFGPDRSMIGSDWPVSAETGARVTLGPWLDRIRRVLAPDDDEWVQLTHASGGRFYGLD